MIRISGLTTSNKFLRDSVLHKMNLFTHGDSNTYGSELVENKPWPVLLSNKLECDVENFAKPGFSNDRIIRDTIGYVTNNLNKSDNLIVIIGFTEMSRTEFFSDELKSWISIETGNINNERIPYSKEYYTKFHSFVSDGILFWQKVLLLQSFLKLYKIKYIFFSCFRDSLIEKYFFNNNLVPKHLKVLESDSISAKTKYKKYEKELSSRVQYLNKNILSQIDESKFVGLREAYTIYNFEKNKKCLRGQYGHLLEDGHINWSNHLYDNYVQNYGD